MSVKIDAAGRRETAAKVKQFVVGARQLTISSESLAELLGLVETDCRAALDTLAAGGLLRKVKQESGSSLYCKD